MAFIWWVLPMAGRCKAERLEGWWRTQVGLGLPVHGTAFARGWFGSMNMHDVAVPGIIAQAGKLRISLEFRVGIATLNRALQAIQSLLPFARYGIYLYCIAEQIDILGCDGQRLAD